MTRGQDIKLSIKRVLKRNEIDIATAVQCTFCLSWEEHVLNQFFIIYYYVMQNLCERDLIKLFTDGI